MKRNSTLGVAGAILLATSLAFAPASLAADPGPQITAADALTWGPAPGLPAGAEIAVLSGDPSGNGPFVIRLRFPAGYYVPTHSHPTDELISFISGTAHMAFGETAGEKDAQAIGPGAFMRLPAGAWHTLWVDSAMVLELHSTGPFETHLH